jgi:membrane-bound lytic murein transglycosylase B
MSGSQYYSQAVASANAYGVPPSLFTAVINAESGFNPNAYNASSGAAGIAQFIPSTAQSFGIDPYNPSGALNAAAQYLSQLYQRTGSWTGALLAYSGNTSGTTPYPGNPLVAQALAQTGEASGLNPAGSATQPGAAQATGAATTGSGCASFFTTPILCIEAGAAYVGYILLALVVLAVGFWAVARKSG